MLKLKSLFLHGQLNIKGHLVYIGYSFTTLNAADIPNEIILIQYLSSPIRITLVDNCNLLTLIDVYALDYKHTNGVLMLQKQNSLTLYVFNIAKNI